MDLTEPEQRLLAAFRAQQKNGKPKQEALTQPVPFKLTDLDNDASYQHVPLIIPPEYQESAKVALKQAAELDQAKQDWASVWCTKSIDNIGSMKRFLFLEDCHRFVASGIINGSNLKETEPSRLKLCLNILSQKYSEHELNIESGLREVCKKKVFDKDGKLKFRNQPNRKVIDPDDLAKRLLFPRATSFIADLQTHIDAVRGKSHAAEKVLNKNKDGAQEPFAKEKVEANETADKVEAKESSPFALGALICWKDISSGVLATATVLVDGDAGVQDARLGKHVTSGHILTGYPTPMKGHASRSSVLGDVLVRTQDGLPSNLQACIAGKCNVIASKELVWPYKVPPTAVDKGAAKKRGV